MTQSHGSTHWREPAGSGAVPTVTLGRLVHAPVVMAFEWNYGDPLPFGLTFTGDTHRTKLDATGKVVSVGANVPRHDGYVYDKNGLLVPGWLLEGARTNRVIQSQDLTGKTRGTATTSLVLNAGNGADGTATADRVTIGGAGNDILFTPWTGLAAGAAVAWSCWIRVITTGTGAGINILNGNGGASFVTSFNPAVGVLTRVTGTSVADGSGNASPWIRSADGSSWTIEVWGMQAEDGTFSSSYIPTTTTTVTRAAEGASVPFPWSPRAMTAYVKGVNLGTAQDTGTMRLLTLGGGANPRFIVQSAGSNELKGLILNSAGTSAAATSPQTIALGDSFEVRLAYAGGGTSTCGVSDLGGTEQTGAGGAVPMIDGAWSAPSNLYLNSAPTTSQGFAAFQSIRLALGVWSMDQMRKVAPDTTAHTFDTTGTPTGSLVGPAGDYALTVGDLTGKGPVVINGDLGVIY
jgi:hypothetical protein